MKILDQILAWSPDLSDKTIAVWGFAVRPFSSEVAGGPGLELIQGLLFAGARVRAYDRGAIKIIREMLPESEVPNLKLPEDEFAAMEGADALVLMSAWPEFKQPNWSDVAKRMRGRTIFDGCGIWSRDEVGEAGFAYETTTN